MAEWKKFENENEEQFIWRIGKAKDSGTTELSWDDIALIINREFRSDESEYRTEAAYRKRYQQAKQFYEAGVFADLAGNEYINEIRTQQCELKKLKQKLSDERVDYQRTVREQARKESFIELVERVMDRHVKPFAKKESPIIESEDDMIVCLSDLHAGIEVNNYWNVFNTDVLLERLSNYAAQILQIQKTHESKVCELVLAGDNISGLIHENLRLENNEDIVEQIKIAVSYIGGFVDSIREKFEKVRIHCVAGNHSRVTPSKEFHLKGENLDELVPYCLRLMFRESDGVEICDDGLIDESINSFVTRSGKLFYVVHGDKDTPENALQRLTLLTGKKPDGIIMAHRHHNALDTQYCAKIIQTGSVVGVDNHCVDLRIGGEPEQAVIISNAGRTVKCFYDVGLGGEHI